MLRVCVRHVFTSGISEAVSRLILILRVRDIWSNLICLSVEQTVLHEIVEHRVWIWLEFAHDERIAQDVLAQPMLLEVDKLLNLRFIRDQLTLSLEEVCDIVSKQVVRDDESFLPFETLRSRII